MRAIWRYASAEYKGCPTSNYYYNSTSSLSNEKGKQVYFGSGDVVHSGWGKHGSCLHVLLPSGEQGSRKLEQALEADITFKARP